MKVKIIVDDVCSECEQETSSYFEKGGMFDGVMTCEHCGREFMACGMCDIDNADCMGCSVDHNHFVLHPNTTDFVSKEG